MIDPPDKKLPLDYEPARPPTLDWDPRAIRRIISNSLLIVAAVFAIIALVFPYHPSLWALAAAFALCGAVAQYAS